MTQIAGKFIQDNAITGQKLRLGNNEGLRARNAANSSDVTILLLNSSDKPEFQVLPQVGSSLPIPSSIKQLATIEYINNFVVGKSSAKDAVQALSATNVPLTGSVPLVVDGYTATSGDRLALTGQTSGVNNGIYTYADNGSTYTLTRATDFDQVDDASGLEVKSGAYFFVVNGSTYAGYEVQLTTANPITIGVTSLTFARYPTNVTILAGDMLSKTGNTLSVNLASLSGLKSTNPGVAGGQLMVKTDTASLEKDQTTRIDPSSGAVMAKASKKYRYTLIASDITNGYIDLPDVAGNNSVKFCVDGAPPQQETIDYTVNYTGGTNSKTRITFAGGLATGGVSALVATDIVTVYYTSF